MKLKQKASYRVRRASQLTIVAALLAVAAAAWTNPLLAQNVVGVSTVEELYAAVNHPANEGAVIDLAAGTYVLTPTDLSGDPRPNLGSLVLPPGSVLRGHNEYVDLDGDGVWDPRDPSQPEVYADPATETIIDAVNLTGLANPNGYPISVISLGLDNRVEGLTVRNNINAEALIGVTNPRTGGVKGVVANCIVEGGQRGLRTVNLSALFEGNISRNNLGGYRAGLQIFSGGLTNAKWDVTLRNNRFYGNLREGLFVVDFVTNNSQLSVYSINNIYEQNGRGVRLSAGNDAAHSAGSNGNQLSFVSIGDAIWNNKPGGGIIGSAGAHNNPLGGTSSDNLLKLKLIRPRFVNGLGSENWLGTERRDLGVYGGVGNRGIFPGSGNVAELILRHGISDGAPGAFVCIDSDPSGTNKVVVIDFDIDGKHHRDGDRDGDNSCEDHHDPSRP